MILQTLNANFLNYIFQYRFEINHRLNMISRLKKVSFCSHLLLRPSLFFGSKLNVEFHKAVLASEIISTIKNSPLNDYQSKNFQSLRERILEGIKRYETQQNNSQDKEFIEKAANEVWKCFEDGVYVPLYMCNQNRNHEQIINFPKVIKQNGQIQILNVQQMDKKELDIAQFRRLKFCPTYIVTGQIFRQIFKLSDYSLITGQYGVGNTYSFILYTLLSEMIFRYRHKYCSGIDDLPKEINFQIPKSVYLSMNIDQAFKDEKQYKEKIQTIFKCQFYELKDFWVNQNIFTIRPSLRLHYAKLGIRTQLLHDQINEAASAIREYRVIQKLLGKLWSQKRRIQEKQKENISNQQVLKQLHQKSKEIINKISQINGRMDNKLKKLKKYQYFEQILNQLIGNKCFYSILYLSSVDIENNLLGQLELMGRSKQDSIQSQIIRLQYPTSLFSNVAIADTCQMIILNLKLYWQEKNNSKLKDLSKSNHQQQEKIMNRIQKQLNVIMRQRQFFFVLPLTTKQFFGKQQTQFVQQFSFQNLKQNNKNELNKKLKALVEQLQEKSSQKMDIQYELKKIKVQNNNSRIFSKIIEQNLSDFFEKHEQKSRIEYCLDKFWFYSLKKSLDSFISDYIFDNFVPLPFFYTYMLFGPDHCNWVCAQS